VLKELEDLYGRRPGGEFPCALGAKFPKLDNVVKEDPAAAIPPAESS